MRDLKKLQAKFFSDPDWQEVDDMIREYINPLLEMDSIDTTMPAEHVKAEIIARTKAYNILDRFLRETGLVQRGRDLPTKAIFK